MAMERAWIKVLGDEEAGEELESLYDENRNKDGSVDHILMIHSLDPESMSGHIAVYRNAMKGTPELSRAQREMIAVVVSQANGCHY